MTKNKTISVDISFDNFYENNSKRWWMDFVIIPYISFYINKQKYQGWSQYQLNLDFRFLLWGVFLKSIIFKKLINVHSRNSKPTNHGTV